MGLKTHLWLLCFLCGHVIAIVVQTENSEEFGKRKIPKEAEDSMIRRVEEEMLALNKTDDPRDKRALGILVQGLVQALGWNPMPLQLASLPNNATTQSPPASPPPEQPQAAAAAPAPTRLRETVKFTGVVNFGNNSNILGHLRQYETLFHGTSAAPATGPPDKSSTTPLPPLPPPPPPPPPPQLSDQIDLRSEDDQSTRPPLLVPYLVKIPLPIAPNLPPPFLPAFSPIRRNKNKKQYKEKEKDDEEYKNDDYNSREEYNSKNEDDSDEDDRPQKAYEPQQNDDEDYEYKKKENKENYSVENKEIYSEKEVTKDPPRSFDENSYADEPPWKKEHEERVTELSRKQKNNYNQNNNREKAARLHDENEEREKYDHENRDDDSRESYEDSREDDYSGEERYEEKPSNDEDDSREKYDEETSSEEYSTKRPTQEPIEYGDYEEGSTKRKQYQKPEGPPKNTGKILKDKGYKNPGESTGIKFKEDEKPDKYNSEYYPENYPSTVLPINYNREKSKGNEILRNSYGESLEKPGVVDERIAGYFTMFKNPQTGIYDPSRLQNIERIQSKGSFRSGRKIEKLKKDSNYLPAENKYEEYDLPKSEQPKSGRKGNNDDAKSFKKTYVKSKNFVRPEASSNDSDLKDGREPSESKPQRQRFNHSPRKTASQYDYKPSDIKNVTNPVSKYNHTSRRRTNSTIRGTTPSYQNDNSSQSPKRRKPSNLQTQKESQSQEEYKPAASKRRKYPRRQFNHTSPFSTNKESQGSSDFTSPVSIISGSQGLPDYTSPVPNRNTQDTPHYTTTYYSSPNYVTTVFKNGLPERYQPTTLPTSTNKIPEGHQVYFSDYSASPSKETSNTATTTTYIQQRPEQQFDHAKYSSYINPGNSYYFPNNFEQAKIKDSGIQIQEATRLYDGIDFIPTVGLPEKLTVKNLHEGEGKEFRAWPAPFDYVFDGTVSTNVVHPGTVQPITSIPVYNTYQEPIFTTPSIYFDYPFNRRSSRSQEEVETTKKEDFNGKEFPVRAYFQISPETQSSHPRREEIAEVATKISPGETNPPVSNDENVDGKYSSYPDDSHQYEYEFTSPEKVNPSFIEDPHYVPIGGVNSYHFYLPSKSIIKTVSNVKVPTDKKSGSEYTSDSEYQLDSDSQADSKSQEPRKEAITKAHQIEYEKPSVPTDCLQTSGGNEKKRFTNYRERENVKNDGPKEDPNNIQENREQRNHDFFVFNGDDYGFESKKHPESSEAIETKTKKVSTSIPEAITYYYDESLTKFTERPESETVKAKAEEYGNKIATSKVSERKQQSPVKLIENNRRF